MVHSLATNGAKLTLGARRSDFLARVHFACFFFVKLQLLLLRAQLPGGAWVRCALAVVGFHRVLSSRPQQIGHDRRQSGDRLWCGLCILIFAGTERPSPCVLLNTSCQMPQLRRRFRRRARCRIALGSK